MKKKRTILDVARLARVSPATVSRVINRTARVTPAVEKRVRASAEKLGFDLRRSSRLIGFLLGNRSLLHPFHSQVLLAAEAYCAALDYSLLFFALHYPGGVDWRRLHVPQMLQRRDLLDGFLVAGVNHQNLLDLLSQAALPFVVFGDTMQGPWRASDVDVVSIDDITGAFDVVKYLQSLGHRRIWFVANTQMAWFGRRFEGYTRAMQQSGLSPLVGDLDSPREQEVGYLAVKQILSRGESVDAIFAASDAICHGVYAALREAGLSVPNDISVVGFNDTPEAIVLHPALTTVCVFPEQVGRLMGQFLMRRIEDPGIPRQEIVIPTQLVKRESCTPLAAPPQLPREARLRA